MPRKKHAAAEAEGPAMRADGDTVAGTLSQQSGGTSEPTAPVAEPGAEADAEAQGKSWGPPYKAIFTSRAKGFEMGEDRRYKQRVFKFVEKPDPEILAVLKGSGFVYRAEEKAWTIHADHASRLLSDELAAKFAGESPGVNR